MRRIDHQTIDARFHQFISALSEISGRSYRRGDAQSSQVIFRRGRIFDRFLNVFDCNQAFQMLVAINDQKFLDAMLLQNSLRLIERRADRNSDERLFGHYFRNRQFESRLESQIAVRDDAHQVTGFIDYRDAADVIALHHVKRFAHRPILTNRDRIDDHAGL